MNMVDSQPANESDPAARQGGEAGARRGGAVAVVDTAELFAGGTEVRLVHRGQEYRLRITRQGKLILTK
jgi:hemin uptake protein HemP